MREYLYKAKTEMIVRTYNNGKDDGEWVQGYLRCDCGMWLIYQFEYDRADQVAYEVNPETICQCIGMTDRHKNRLWENDIVEIVSSPKASHKYLLWWNKEMSLMDAIPLEGIDFNGHDYWNGNYPNFHYETFCTMMQDPWGDFSDIKVIGNIIDNPELIERK